MKTALALEKTVNEALFKLHEVAVTNKDDEVSYSISKFMQHHVIAKQLKAHANVLLCLQNDRPSLPLQTAHRVSALVPPPWTFWILIFHFPGTSINF